MLKEHEFGYAVMSEDLSGISLEDKDIEICKRYCRRTDVIVERIPTIKGFVFEILWLNNFYKPISRRNILWLHWYFSNRYFHRSGKLVYKNGGN